MSGVELERAGTTSAGLEGEASESSAKPSRGDVARRAGRGGLAVAFAKVYFILLGLVQQILLPRVLGLGGYGALSSALSIASISYNPVISTSIQGVSRAVAEAAPSEVPATVRRVLSIHALLAVAFGAAFFLGAPLVAELIGAPHIAPPLQVLSVVMLCYGLYTPLIGVLNGSKRFLAQAGFDIFAATVRTLGLLLGAYLFASHLGEGVLGASVGFAGGAGLILAAALLVVGVGRAGAGGPAAKQHLLFIAPLFFGQLLLNLLLQADLTLLRAFAAESARDAGLAVEAADPLVGAYRASQLFCFLPYQILIAVTFILFPMLATAHRDRDRAAVAEYTKTGVRLSLLISGLMVSVSSGLSGPLLRLVFSNEAAELATRSMQLLTIGFGAFAVFGVLTSVLNSLKRERASAIVTALAFLLVVVLCAWRVRGGPFGEELLFRTAVATSAGLLLATLVSAVLVRRTAGAVAPPLSVLRVLFAMSLAIALGRWLPEGSKLLTVAYAALVALAYFVLLVSTRELGQDDLRLLRAVVGRRQR